MSSNIDQCLSIVASCLDTISQSGRDVQKLSADYHKVKHDFEQQHKLALSLFALQLSAQRIKYDRVSIVNSLSDLGNKMEEVSILLAEYLNRDDITQEARDCCLTFNESLEFYIKYIDKLLEEYTKVRDYKYTGWFGWCISLLSWAKWIQLCWVLRGTSNWLFSTSEKLIPVIAVKKELVYNKFCEVSKNRSDGNNFADICIKRLQEYIIKVDACISSLPDHQEWRNLCNTYKQYHERLVNYVRSKEACGGGSRIIGSRCFAENNGDLYNSINEKLAVLCKFMRANEDEKSTMLSGINLDINHLCYTNEIIIYKTCVQPIIDHISFLRDMHDKINRSTSLLNFWFRLQFFRRMNLLEIIIDKCNKNLIDLLPHTNVRDTLNHYRDLVELCLPTEHQKTLLQGLQDTLRTFHSTIEKTFKAQSEEKPAVLAASVVGNDVRTAESQEFENSIPFAQLLQEADAQVCINKRVKKSSSSSYSVLFDQAAALNI